MSMVQDRVERFLVNTMRRIGADDAEKREAVFG